MSVVQVCGVVCEVVAAGRVEVDSCPVVRAYSVVCEVVAAGRVEADSTPVVRACVVVCEIVVIRRIKSDAVSPGSETIEARIVVFYAPVLCILVVYPIIPPRHRDVLHHHVGEGGTAVIDENADSAVGIVAIYRVALAVKDDVA